MIPTLRNILLWAIAICLSTGSIQAQVEMQLPQSPIFSFEVETLWAISLQNPPLGLGQVYLEATIKNEAQQEVLWAKSASFSLSESRVFQIQDGQLASVETQWRIERDSLQAGNYEICISLRTRDYEQLLVQECVRREIQSFPTQSSKEDQAFAFSGYVRLSGQLSNRQGYFSEIPPNYLRLQAAPRFSAFGIPLEMQFFLSTEQQGLRYDINTVALKLDRQSLLRTLQQTAQEKLNQAVSQQATNLPFDTTYLSQLNNMRDQSMADLLTEHDKLAELSQLDWKEIEKNLAELKRTESLLEHDAFRSVDKEWNKLLQKHGFSEGISREAVEDSLCIQYPEQCDTYRSLLSRKEELDKLRQRYEELKALSRTYKKMLAMREQVGQLEKLKNDDYRSLLRDPKQLAKLPIFDKGQKLLMSVQELGVGVTYPYYTPLTMDGVMVKGLNLAVNPGKIYAAITGGKLGRSLLSQDTLGSTGMLYAGRLGLGGTQSDHLHFLYSLSKDASELPGAVVENQVMGLSGQWTYKKWLRLDGEWNYARSWGQLGDTSIWDIEEPFSPQSPMLGTAWRAGLEARWMQGKSRLNASYGKIDPSYYAAGAPLLIRDRERYDLRLQQSFWENKLELAAFYRKDFDPNVPQPYTEVSVQAMGIRAGFRPRKGPQVQFDYAPYVIRQERPDSLSQVQQTSLLSLTTSYAYKAGAFGGSSTLSWVLQQQQKEAALQQAHVLTLNQLLKYGPLWSLWMSGTYMDGNYTETYGRTYSVDGAIQFTTRKYGSHALGVVWLEEEGEQGASRKGIYLSGNLPLGKKLNLEWRMERNYLRNYLPNLPEQDEYLARLSVNYRW